MSGQAAGPRRAPTTDQTASTNAETPVCRWEADRWEGTSNSRMGEFAAAVIVASSALVPPCRHRTDRDLSDYARSESG